MASYAAGDANFGSALTARSTASYLFIFFPLTLYLAYVYLVYPMRKYVTKARAKAKPKARPKIAPTAKRSYAQGELMTQTPLFPVRVQKKLPYFESAFTITGTAGVIGSYIFSANGAYDPNISGTGHQPLGFDTMMTYYEQYVVVASRITVECCGNGIQAGTFSISLSPDTTAPALPDVVENGLVVMKTIDGRGTNGTGQRIGSLSLSCDVAKYFGRKSKADLVDDANMSGTVASNPAEQVYFTVAAWGFSSFSDNTSFAMTALIEYDVVFWEPRKVAAQ